jgi:hypothetical protein
MTVQPNISAVERQGGRAALVKTFFGKFTRDEIDAQ